MKRAFKMKQKAFFINFKGLSLKPVKEIFLEGQSPNLTKTFNDSFYKLFFCYKLITRKYHILLKASRFHSSKLIKKLLEDKK